MSSLPGTTLPLDYVKKYAPSVKFHGMERVFPCDIEYLVQGGTLNYRPWSEAATVGSQRTGVPAVVAFNGYIYMVYTGAQDAEIWVTRSQDGITWTDMHQIGQQTSVPAIAVFKEKLWITYSAHHSAQMYVSCSSDGLAWEDPKQIDGQSTYVPALVQFENRLYMCYASDYDGQLYQSQSDDGWTWYNTKKSIPGQVTSTPALTVIPGPDGDQILMVYPDEKRNHQLIQTRYTSSGGWTTPQDIVGQQAWSVGLSNYNGTAIMAYSGNTNSQLFSSTSTDGINWIFSEILFQGSPYYPALCSFGEKIYMLYSGNDADKQIYVSSVKHGNITPPPPKPMISQQDLADCGDDPNWWINIADSQWRGDKKPGPTTLYFAVQEDTSAWYIHYIFLYAGQNGQTLRGNPKSSNGYNAQLKSIGEHPGDLERFAVMVWKGTGGDAGPKVGDVAGCWFEAHGDIRWYEPKDIFWNLDNHATVSAALNNHSHWNEKIEGSNPSEVNIDQVLIGNFLGLTWGDPEIWWRTWDDNGSTTTRFVQLGLDSAGRPVNDQIWATFKGRMGDSYKTDLDSATYFNGSNLSDVDWAETKIIFTAGSVIKVIPSSLLTADGPRGPGDRDWMRPLPEPK